MTSSITEQRTALRVSAGEERSEFSEGISAADVTAVEVGSTGLQALEPLVVATHEGRTAFYTDCSAKRAAEIAADLARGTFEEGADAVVDHDPEVTALPTPDVGGLDIGTRDVLGGCGWRRPTNADDHAAAGGFADAESDDVQRTAETLRGRGWGDWCHDEFLSETWRTVRDAGDAAVVVNAHGSGADTLLLESVPFEVLEGASLAAQAVGADRVVVYLSATDEFAASRVREASENYPDPAAPIEVVTGPAAYRAAEPTMALEAIEGNHRLEARLRPPGPERVGLFGEPTLVHTARTLAHLAVSVREGKSPATRLVTVSGDIDAPATIELPETARLDTILDAVPVPGEFKAACVGGRFGGVSPSLDVAAGPDALSALDLGTEGEIEVLASDRCIVEFVGKRAGFAAETNCGRCVPCREGTTQLTNLLRDIYDGEYNSGKIAELIRVMDTTSICAFGVNAGRPTRTAMAAFEAEFEAHANGECPTGSCTNAIEQLH